MLISHNNLTINHLSAINCSANRNKKAGNDLHCSGDNKKKLRRDLYRGENAGQINI